MATVTYYGTLHLYVGDDDERAARNQTIIQKLKEDNGPNLSRITIDGGNPNGLECFLDLASLGNLIGRSTQLVELIFDRFGGNVLNSLINNSFCAGMNKNESIECIRFSNIRLNDGKFFTALLPFFENNNNLVKIVLSGNHDGSSARIARALSRCNNSGTFLVVLVHRDVQFFWL